ncbi:uncharacterized protein Z520_01212 [Fonsecaea multimorphosa CBS 102226]|uniref:Major facilitator superfamily (MFS) profile domain-containing protein n=1 Tax=Fonsecaea multimorphosa CBS 102226 TaxID=1442371 RepID=A0A0D2J048_9EURO|nr:uncharacterized protein Z520_01212 [Fonsecaea multimorphosa CBS 102226]KIY02747.1 hypothetical protein Z520_01212 [Fonsecaea multimorphosa CBS 102226]
MSTTEPTDAMASSLGSKIRTILICCFVMCGSLLFGIDSGELGGFQAMVSFLKDYGYFDEGTDSYNIRTRIQTSLNAVLLVGAILASISAGPIGTKYGRRVGLIWMGLVAVVGVIFQISVPHVWGLLLGRFFAGVALDWYQRTANVGFCSSFVPIYQAEVAPTQMRGMMIALYQTGINIGQLIGSCINQGTYKMSTRWAYRIPLITQLIFPTILIVFASFFPESPRWLLSVGKVEESARSIRRLRGKTYPEHQIHADVDDIAKHIRLEQELEGSSSFLDAFRGSDRRRTHIACGLLLWQVLSGISFINGYGTYFYSVSGISNAFVVSIISQVCQLAGIIAMFPSVHFLGRRTILLWGAAAETICMFTFAIVGTVAPNSVAAARCLVAFSCLYAFFFTWSWGPVAWIVASEIGSNVMRSRTQALGSAVSWAGTLLIAVVLPYLINPTAADLGAKVGFIFGVTCLFGFVWALFFLPETKGRSLEQLDELFLNGVSVKEFSTYQCRGHVEYERNGVITTAELNEDTKEVVAIHSEHTKAA